MGPPESRTGHPENQEGRPKRVIEEVLDMRVSP